MNNLDINKYYPKTLDKTWDVIVIGAGMGGSVLGYEMAKSGKEVLFLEAGHYLPNVLKDSSDYNWDETDYHVRKKNGHWPSKIKGMTSFGERDSFVAIGCGVGGSTSIYAAQLERMHPSDFKPQENFTYKHDANLPESWPIKFKDFEKYYRLAERMFKVSGTQDPLNIDNKANLCSPPELTYSNKHLFNDLEKFGLNPYRSHVACDWLKDCDGCSMVFCTNRCKNDAGKVCIEPALDIYRAEIITNCEVIELESNDERVRFVKCKINNDIIKLQGKVIILAAGAILTPALLLKSSSKAWPNGLCNSSNLVGRNLMWHASDVFAIKPKKTFGKYLSKRQITFNDFYFVNGLKCGNIQEMGYNWFTREKLKSIILKRLSKFNLIISSDSFLLNTLSYMAEYRFKGANMFASIIEDLPYLDNKVYLNKGEINFNYKYTKELIIRCKALRKQLSKTIKEKYKLIPLSKTDNINFGHACGTCRFGNDPKDSVLNAQNRTHDMNNLFIVDASFFPTSSGANPSLTIAANAIRVAGYIENNWKIFD
jgi:choline dehydrogenase-like flavoprotein